MVVVGRADLVQLQSSKYCDYGKRQLPYSKASREMWACEIIVYHPYDCFNKTKCVSVWLTLLQPKTIYMDVESCLLVANL